MITRIWAILASDLKEIPPVGTLVSVELPANCSVFGNVPEMRVMLQDAVNIARTFMPEDAYKSNARLTEIEAWLKGDEP